LYAIAKRCDRRRGRKLLEVGNLEVVASGSRSAAIERNGKVPERPRGNRSGPRQRSTPTLGGCGNGEDWLVGRFPTKAWHY